MSDFRNANGSTGVLKEGKFVAFATQDEADQSQGAAQKPEPKPSRKKADDKEE